MASPQIKLSMLKDNSDGSSSPDHFVSSSDILRIDEKWSDKHEKYLQEIKNDCVIKSKQQLMKYHRHKRYYYALGIPNIVIPLSLSSLNPLFHNLNYINIGGSAVSSILSGLSTFFNVGSSMQKHLEFKNKYDDIINDIDVILLKNKKFRTPPNITIEQIKNKYENTNNLCPL